MEIVSKPTKQQVILQDSHGPLVGFIVGVDDYDKTSGFSPLKTCVNDALELRNTLHDVLQLNADKSRITVLTSKHDKLSRTTILSGLVKAVQTTTINDRFLFYFSGHGYRLKDYPDNFYLVPPDVFSDNDPTYFVDFDKVLDILASSPAKQKIVILDACFSGAIVSGAKSHGVAYSPKFLKGYLQKTHGLIVIGSSSGEEKSFTKSPDKNLSLFTYFFLRALRGEPKALMQNLWLSVSSLYDYVSMAVQQQAKDYHITQSPTIETKADGTVLIADFGKLMLPATNVELGDYPVTRFEISSIGQRMSVKKILTELTRTYNESYIEMKANQVLPEYLEDELSSKASRIVKALDVTEAAVNVAGAGIEFPGGSYTCEYSALDKKNGVIQYTLIIEKQLFESAEKIPQLVEAVGIYASEFSIHFKNYFEPRSIIPGLKAMDWKVDAHRDEKVVVSQKGYELTIEPAKITLSGFAPRELFGSSPDELKTALVVGVLSLIQ